MSRKPFIRPMWRAVLCLILLTAPAWGEAQTIIELKRGGGVRAKTVDDYKEEMQMNDRLREDSAAYVDNLRRAFNALHTDSLDEAEKLFREALKQRPGSSGNYVIKYNLGLVDMARGRNVEAVEKLSAIIKDYPAYYVARVARAEANLQLGKAREAIEDAELVMERTEKLNTDMDLARRARFVRAAARYRLRYYPEAHADLQHLLDADPQNENAQILDALTLQQMGQPKEALNRLNLIVSAHPQSVDALTARASVEYELGLNTLARADYDALIALYPDESGYYVERARALIRLEEKLAARRDLDRAIQLGVPRGMVQSLYNLTR